MKKDYTLLEVAQEWGKRETDILNYAEDKRLTLSIYWKGYYNEFFPDKNLITQDRGPLDDFVNIGSVYARRFLHLSADSREIDKGKIEIGEQCFLQNGQHINLLILWGNDGSTAYPMFTQSDLRVLAAEKARFENENSELFEKPLESQGENQAGDKDDLRGLKDIEWRFRPFCRNTIKGWAKKIGYDQRFSFLPGEVVREMEKQNKGKIDRKRKKL
jgi:hypothetical protein